MTRSLAHLEKLIAFPSVSRDSNLDLIAYVQDVLAKLDQLDALWNKFSAETRGGTAAHATHAREVLDQIQQIQKARKAGSKTP